MTVNYDSNNSGGSWWLTDQDWINLEKAGWHIEWGGLELENPNERIRKYENFKEANKDRWLGSVAQSCHKEFNTIRESLVEFEKITNQNVSDRGCNCCGPPHSFNWKDKKDKTRDISGEECLNYLYDNVPSFLRDACS